MTQTDNAPLTCMACGHIIDAVKRFPLMRCSACGALGYPDRADRHLTTLSWTCSSCGASNNGLHNFCLECGAGLTSRCLRCEAPVYSAICLNCGAHQARTWRFETEQRYRQDSSTPRPLTPQERAERAEMINVSGWRELDKRWRRATRRRARRWRGRQRAWLLWLVLLFMMPVVWELVGLWPTVLWGTGALLWGALPGRARRTIAALLMVGAVMWAASPYLATVEEVVVPLFNSVGEWLARFERDVWPHVINWWKQFAATLPEIRELETNDPRYAALFATIAFSIAALPAAIYLIDRIVRRLFRG